MRERYRRAGGLELKRRKKRSLRKYKKHVFELVKRAFSAERNTGIVYLSTVPFITERWVDGERQISSFMVTLPYWVSEARILEAINLGFGFLKEKTET